MKSIKYCLTVFVVLITGLGMVPGAYGDEPGMALIPAGSFKLSSSGEKVHLEKFYIDKTEVTQKQYVDVMGKHRFFFKGDDHPAEQVNWFQAKEFCAKVGKRLPTEAEWEKAAKSGTRTKYFWGSRPDPSYGWYGGHHDIGHNPVGKKKPNSFGLYDTSGNVWEWTATQEEFNSNYSEGTVEKSIARGGAYNVTVSLVTSSSRLVLYPKNRAFNLGFRCAK